ncbi:MAG: lipid A biosynthesis acyltransferase [Woeseia sp.]
MLRARLLLAFLKPSSRLPYALQMRMGSIAGRLIFLYARKRRAIAARNIELCFPRLTAAKRKELLLAHFASLGRALFESGLAYWAPDARLHDLAQISGLENLQAALARGRGVILIAGHFTAMELGGRMLGLATEYDAVIRPFSNAQIDAIVRAGRQRAVRKTIPKKDFRELLEGLRQNRAVLITVDQATTAANRVMAPFFGVPAPTSVVAARIARRTGAAVLPVLWLRKGDRSGYRVEVGEPLADFPSAGRLTDAARINTLIEEQVLEAPEQYYWIHRRFKTEPSPYFL